MKRQPVLIPRTFGRNLLAAAAAALIGVSASEAAIQVTATGAGPLTFDSAPSAADWSYRSISGAGNTYNDATAVDTAVQGVTAASITAGLTTDSANPPGTSGNGRWNSTLHCIQTRPTGNAGTLVMATLTNVSGGTIADMEIAYDENSYNAASGQLPGWAVYYSLTGDANSWVAIPELSYTEVVGSHSATIHPAWAANTAMYLLFVDDNADGITDPSYTLDNFSIAFPGQPPVVVQSPAGVSTNEYSSVTLNVTAGGTPPLTYQWYKNGSPIAGATGASLLVTNTGGSGRTWVTPSDSGDYSVVVTGSVLPPATSSVAHVAIAADTVAPRFVRAFAEPVGADTIVRIELSEVINNMLVLTNEVLDWSVGSLGNNGGGVPDSITNFSATEIGLIFLNAQPNAAESFTVNFTGSTAYDRAETPNALSETVIPVYAHVVEAVAMTGSWKYSDIDQPAPAGWQEAAFDDSDSAFWKTGVGPFDAKRSGSQVCRATSLYDLGNVGTCLLLSNPPTAVVAQPSYYFRTHFAYNAQVQTNVVIRMNGKFDDGAVIWLNGVELTRIRIAVTNQLLHTNYNTLGNAVGDSDAQDIEYIAPGSALHSGDNVLAIYLAQVNSTSSDITMGVRMFVGATEPLQAPVVQPRLSVATVGNDVKVSWTPVGGSLLQATSVSGPYSTNNSAGNPYQFTPSGPQLYFRVAQ